MNVLVRCTDRGDHPVRYLCWLLAEHRDGILEIVLVPWAAGRELFDADRPTLRGTLRIPPCPRHTCAAPPLPPMDQETAVRLYDALALREITTLDVSML